MDERYFGDESMSRRAAVMGKWLWVLFWLQIAGMVIGLFDGAVSAIGDVVRGLAYAWILLQMKGEDERYGKAAVFMMIAVVLQTVADLMDGSVAILSIVILIPALVLSLMATYQEYCAHSSVVGSADTFLGQRWMTLWKWQIVSIGGLLVSTLLLLVAPPLGALLVVVVGVIGIVAGVLTLVNLYKSAQAFRKIAA